MARDLERKRYTDWVSHERQKARRAVARMEREAVKSGIYKKDYATQMRFQDSLDDFRRRTESIIASTYSKKNPDSWKDAANELAKFNRENRLYERLSQTGERAQKRYDKGDIKNISEAEFLAQRTEKVRDEIKQFQRYRDNIDFYSGEIRSDTKSSVSYSDIEPDMQDLVSEDEFLEAQNDRRYVERQSNASDENESVIRSDYMRDLPDSRINSLVEIALRFSTKQPDDTLSENMITDLSMGITPNQAHTFFAYLQPYMELAGHNTKNLLSVALKGYQHDYPEAGIENYRDLFLFVMNLVFHGDANFDDWVNNIDIPDVTEERYQQIVNAMAEKMHANRLQTIKTISPVYGASAL